MSYFRVTLRRSAIGLPERTHGVLAALGLRRRDQTVFHEVSPAAAGMIMRVKELVAVEEVDRSLSTRELRDARRPDPGFRVESRAADSLPLPPPAARAGNGAPSPAPSPSPSPERSVPR